MLKINNLSIKISEKEVLKNINLNVKKGEFHVILGPNGAGKTSLVNSIIGHKNYNISSGEIYFKDTKINDVNINTRALMGMFLAFQHPREIDGLEIENFLYQIYKNKNNYIKKDSLAIFKFRVFLDEIMYRMDLNKDFKNRYLNLNFSGGEKKKLELLQMAILDPDLIILDESDSGLDVDAKNILIKEIKHHAKNKNKSFILISHDLDILKKLDIDFIHIIKNGEIMKTKDSSLINTIGKEGYKFI